MKKIFALTVLALAPLAAFAQAGLDTLKASGTANTTGLSEIYQFLVSVAGAAVTFITTLAVLYFLWGVFQYIASSGDPKKQGEGRGRMIAGIIGLAVMVSVNGLVYWITNTAGTSGSGTTALPTVTLPATGVSGN